MSGATMFVHQACAAFLLIMLTLWFQSGGIAALIAWVRHAVEGDIHKLDHIRSAALVVRLATAMIALHGLEILLWASCYRLLCFPSWEPALYFSASSYATVGYGDVVLPWKWRMLGPLESIIGVLMCGISVSLLFAIVTRLINRDERFSRK
jgi:voltage-gated potassium channel